MAYGDFFDTHSLLSGRNHDLGQKINKLTTIKREGRMRISLSYHRLGRGRDMKVLSQGVYLFKSLVSFMHTPQNTNRCPPPSSDPFQSNLNIFNVSYQFIKLFYINYG
jgi:hypothetical protein